MFSSARIRVSSHIIPL